MSEEEGVGQDPSFRVGATTAFCNAVAAFISAQGNIISLHSADPGTAGTVGEITTAGTRRATTWGAPTAGTGPDAGKAVVTGSVVEFTVPLGATVAFYGVWTAAGVFQYSKPVFPTATFPVVGTAAVTPRHSFGLI
jgi:hypothetical protein